MSYFILFRNGLISGLLSGISIFVPCAGYCWLPGVIFGVLVMLAFVRCVDDWSTCAFGFVILSTFAYFVAFLIQWQASVSSAVEYVLTCGVAGLVGAAIVGVSFLAVLRMPLVRPLLLVVLAAGAATGLLFGTLIVLLPSDDFFWPFKIVLGFAVWQSCSAAPLGRVLVEFH